MRERPFVAASEAAQSGRVWLDELPREACLSLGPVLGAGSEELAEILVALAILDEEAEPRAVIRMLRVTRGALFEHQLRADERGDAGLLRRHEEARRTIDAVPLDERHGGTVLPCRLRHEGLREPGSLAA